MIYWIKAGDTGLVKVGMASNVAKRLATLQTGCPYPMILLRQEPGGRDIEAALHRHYRAKHARAEWFALDGCDVAVDLGTVDLGTAARHLRFIEAVPSSKLTMTLSDYLKQPKVTASGVARAVGVTHSTVLRWADGSIQPPMDRLRKLNEVTAGKVTPNDFLTVAA